MTLSVAERLLVTKISFAPGRFARAQGASPTEISASRVPASSETETLSLSGFTFQIRSPETPGTTISVPEWRGSTGNGVTASRFSRSIGVISVKRAVGVG